MVKNALEITDDLFRVEVLESEDPVLVDFWAPWCGPCRAIASIVEEIAEEYVNKIKVFKLNVDESPATPGEYGIRAIPTLIVFYKGKIVEQVTGAVSKEQLRLVLEKVL